MAQVTVKESVERDLGEVALRPRAEIEASLNRWAVDTVRLGRTPRLPLRPIAPSADPKGLRPRGATASATPTGPLC